MRNLFTGMETLEVNMQRDLGFVEYTSILEISNTYYITLDALDGNVDIKELVRQQLISSILHEIYGGLKPLLHRLADMAKTSEYTNSTEIHDIVEDAHKIFKGE